MGVIFNFGEESEEEQPGKMITFSKLNFITDQFRTCAFRNLSQPKRGNIPSRSVLSPSDWRGLWTPDQTPSQGTSSVVPTFSLKMDEKVSQSPLFTSAKSRISTPLQIWYQHLTVTTPDL
jgi:hypothetical protein